MTAPAIILQANPQKYAGIKGTHSLAPPPHDYTGHSQAGKAQGWVAGRGQCSRAWVDLDHVGAGLPLLVVSMGTVPVLYG